MSKIYWSTEQGIESIGNLSKFVSKPVSETNFLWAVNHNNAKNTFRTKNTVEIEQLERTLNTPGWLAWKIILSGFVTLLFRFYYITFGHITFQDIVLSCIFLLWAYSIKELNQYYLNKTRKSDRITELSVISINWAETYGKSKASYYFFSTWFSRRSLPDKVGTDQLSFENYTEYRAIKYAIHHWFHWFRVHTEVAVFNIYLTCRKRTGFVLCKKNKKNVYRPP